MWVVLCVGLAAVFVASGLGGPLPSLLAGAFLVLLPGIALAQRSLPVEELRAHRSAAYASSVLGLGLMALAALWAWPEMGRGIGEWLDWPGSPAALLGTSALLTTGGLSLSYAFRGLGARLGWRETDLVRAIMPVTPGEKGVFVLLSTAAGTCEEIVFRGFVPLFLMPWFGGYLLAALPTCAVFGILHAYQGAHGMVRTAAMGLVLAGGVAWTGSLLPSILAHAALNVLIGLVLADSLLGGETGEE